MKLETFAKNLRAAMSLLGVEPSCAELAIVITEIEASSKTPAVNLQRFIAVARKLKQCTSTHSSKDEKMSGGWSGIVANGYKAKQNAHNDWQCMRRASVDRRRVR